MKLEELCESLSSAYSFKIIRKDDDQFDAEFETANGKVKFGSARFDFGFKVLDDEEPADKWEVAFERIENKDGIRKTHYGMSGQGDEFKVFATIIKILEKFIDLYSPQQIEFTSEKSEQSRTRLYQKLINKYKPTGYEVSTDKSSSDYRTYFILKKKS